MGCRLLVENSHPFIPIGAAFKASLKIDNSTPWIEVVDLSNGAGMYLFTTPNSRLEMLQDQTEYPGDSRAVKIIF